MFPCGTIWYEKGNTEPAIIEIREGGAVYIKNRREETIISFSRSEIMELNKRWIKQEMNIPNEKTKNDKG